MNNAIKYKCKSCNLRFRISPSSRSKIIANRDPAGHFCSLNCAVNFGISWSYKQTQMNEICITPCIRALNHAECNKGMLCFRLISKNPDAVCFLCHLPIEHGSRKLPGEKIAHLFGMCPR